MPDKFPEEQRTFETRLLYIKELFSNLYPKSQIMTSCIEHKLGRSFEQYEQDLKGSVTKLSTEDPIKVLKKIK